MTEVSSTRLYLGNLPRGVTKADVEAHFASHGTGEITEIKLMNGFGFIEYKDAMDARDVVPAFHGSDFMGERLTVQFARGNRRTENNFGNGDRSNPRPRRTQHQMHITGLPNDTSWQDLKDFARQSGLDVVYSETGKPGSNEGTVEFETAADLRIAVEKLDGREFKGSRVQCTPNLNAGRGGRDRSRSPRRPYPPPADDLYDRRGPPRPYSPPRAYREGYRDRSPPRRDYHDQDYRRGGYRSPPRRGGPPPMDDYIPSRGGPRYDDYRGGPRDYPPEMYMNGRGYDRRPPPPDFPPRDAYSREPYPPRDYERRY